MLEIKNLSIKLKEGRCLLNDFNLIVNKSDKIALIGEEGNGKSTLIKYILNPNLIKNYCDFKGECNAFNFKVGYLEQFLDKGWENQKIINYFLKENPFEKIDYENYPDLKELIKIFVKLKLDINKLDNDQSIKTLSGGEKVKIQMPSPRE